MNSHDRVVDVDTFRGACMLGRMAAVREVGLMHTLFHWLGAKRQSGTSAAGNMAGG
jgi:GT2 family glycosyltransferase